jgi:hypothetical protein
MPTPAPTSTVERQALRIGELIALLREWQAAVLEGSPAPLLGHLYERTNALLGPDRGGVG